jgi:hypothetical protein
MVLETQNHFAPSLVLKVSSGYEVEVAKGLSDHSPKAGWNAIKGYNIRTCSLTYS